MLEQNRQLCEQLKEMKEKAATSSSKYTDSAVVHNFVSRLVLIEVISFNMNMGNACEWGWNKIDVDCGHLISLLGDDQMLEAVEATFKQFSAFLDLLHDKG